MKPLLLALSGLMLLQSLPAVAAHSFRNSTIIGLRCRLSSETSDRAMTLRLEARQTVTVMGTYKDVRCSEPVVRERWPLSDGSSMVFRRNPDGNTIRLESETP